MTTWQDLESLDAAFANLVQELFTSHKHHMMATLRRDGSPRISGTEVRFIGGQLVLGMMGGALRVAGDAIPGARSPPIPSTLPPRRGS
jgi:hypothetical protein